MMIATVTQLACTSRLCFKSKRSYKIENKFLKCFVLRKRNKFKTEWELGEKLSGKDLTRHLILVNT